MSKFEENNLLFKWLIEKKPSSKIKWQNKIVKKKLRKLNYNNKMKGKKQ